MHGVGDLSIGLGLKAAGFERLSSTSAQTLNSAHVFRQV